MISSKKLPKILVFTFFSLLLSINLVQAQSASKLTELDLGQEPGGAGGDGFLAVAPAASRFVTTPFSSATSFEGIQQFGSRTGVDVAINANFGRAGGCEGFCGDFRDLGYFAADRSLLAAFVVHSGGIEVDGFDSGDLANYDFVDRNGDGLIVPAGNSRYAIVYFFEQRDDVTATSAIAAKLRSAQVEAVVTGNAIARLNNQTSNFPASFGGLTDGSSRTVIGFRDSTQEFVFLTLKSAPYSRVVEALEANEVSSAVMLDGGGSTQMYYAAGFNSVVAGYEADAYNRQHSLTPGTVGAGQDTQLYVPQFARPAENGARARPNFIGAIIPDPPLAEPEIPESPGIEDEELGDGNDNGNPVEPAQPEVPESADLLAVDFRFSPGWNLIHIPVRLPEVTTAATLATALQDQGVAVEFISRYEGSTTRSYIADPEFETGDFELVSGQGLYVFNSGVPAPVTLTGEPRANDSLIVIPSGVSAIGFGQPPPNYSAYQFLDRASGAEIELTQLTRYATGSFTPAVRADGENFGPDFPISSTQGYVVINSGSAGVVAVEWFTGVDCTISLQKRLSSVIVETVLTGI